MIGAIVTLAAAVAYQPAGKWVMNYQQDLCQLTRSFAAGDRRLTFGFRQSPADAQIEVIVLQEGDADPGLYRGWAAIRAGTPAEPMIASTQAVALPNGRRATFDILSNARLAGGEGVSARVPDSAQRILRFLVPRTALEVAMADPAITVEQVGRPALVLQTGAVTRALAALRTCEVDQIRSWGVDPDRIAAPAVPQGEVVKWLALSAIPRDRLRVDETTLRWTITSQGRAENCVVVRSSGNDALDRTGCARLIENARYQPARDAAGQPVPSVKSRRIVWMMG